MFAPKKILVPTDFTRESDRALSEAVDIAKAFRSKVLLIHVDRRIQEVGVDMALSPELVKELSEQDTEAARAKMRAQVRRIALETDVVVQMAERHGTTHEEILRYAQENEVDLIVLDPHAKKGLLKTLLRGGVTDKVAQKALCPVLILH